MLGQCTAVFAFLHVDLFHLALEFLQFSFERVEELAQALLVLLAEALGFFFQNIVSQVFKLMGEFFAGALQQGQFFVALVTLLGELHGQRGDLGIECIELLLGFDETTFNLRQTLCFGFSRRGPGPAK